MKQAFIDSGNYITRYVPLHYYYLIFKHITILFENMLLFNLNCIFTKEVKPKNPSEPQCMTVT